MTSYVTPKKGFPFICYVGLVSQSTGQFQSNPTLAAGDFKLSKDGAALNNLATLPAVTPASSKSVKIALDSDETNADNLVIIGSDAAGAEWDDVFLNIQTTVSQVDDLALASGVNLTKIDGQLTSGNNATLKLKTLDIRNTDGTAEAVHIESSGGSGYSGLNIYGDTANGGWGVELHGSTGLVITGTGSAVQLDAYGTGNAIDAFAHDTGKSINAPQDIALPSGDLDDQLQSIISEVTPLTFDSDNNVYSHPNTPITVTTNNDKTGYSLTSAYDPAKTASQDSDMQDVLSKTNQLTFDSDSYVLSHPMTSVTVGTNNDKANYTLTSAYDASKTAAQDSDMFDVLSYVSHLTFDSDDKVFANAAVSLTSDDIQSIVNALSFPTADENASTLLKYDLSTITGEADRSPINALRKLRNKVSFAGSTLSIKKEDDLTNAYTQSVTQDSDQEPFKSVG